MNLITLLTPERTQYCRNHSNKKRIFECLGQLFDADLPELDPQDIFEAYFTREKLGSTCIGHGVAIPHIRSEHLDKPIAALLYLEKPIEFDINNHENVDLICALIVPHEARDEHLQILAELAKLFSQTKFRNTLRACKDAESLYQAILSYEQ